MKRLIDFIIDSWRIRRKSRFLRRSIRKMDKDLKAWYEVARSADKMNREDLMSHTFDTKIYPIEDKFKYYHKQLEKLISES